MYITDTERHEIIKTDLKGKEVLILPYPRASSKYTKPEDYLPTETAIASNGDIYVADGYGMQHILHYDSFGRLKKVFGGRGDGVDQFNNADGVWGCPSPFSSRTPRLEVDDLDKAQQHTK